MYQENNLPHDHDGVRQVNQFHVSPDLDCVELLDCPHADSRDVINLCHDPKSHIHDEEDDH